MATFWKYETLSIHANVNVDMFNSRFLKGYWITTKLQEQYGVNFESQKSSPIFNSNKFSVFIEFWPGDLQISRQMNTNVPPCLPPVLKLSKKGQDCKAFCPHLKNGPTIIFNYVCFLFSLRLIVKLVLDLDLVLGD